jgi:transcription elongation factor Elf1
MKCPECGQEQYCPCVNCSDRNKDKLTWEWQKEGEFIACGKCGLSAHADWWMDEEAKQFPDRHLL